MPHLRLVERLLCCWNSFFDQFGFIPDATTTKGLLIHNARDVGFSGPDYVSGWGVVDVAQSAKFLRDAANSTSGSGSSNPTEAPVETTANWLYEGSISNGNDVIFEVTADAVSELKISLVWHDPQGAGQDLGEVTDVLVHDLDLDVFGEGNFYQPWRMPDAAQTMGSIGGATDTTLTVDSTFGFPTSGSFKIRVGNELMQVTSVSGNVFTVERGVDDSEIKARTDEPVTLMTEYIQAVRNDGPNTVDNVEQIVIPNADGTFTITISAPAGVSEDFTLLVSGGEIKPDSSSVANTIIVVDFTPEQVAGIATPDSLAETFQSFGNAGFLDFNGDNTVTDHDFAIARNKIRQRVDFLFRRFESSSTSRDIRVFATPKKHVGE